MKVQINTPYNIDVKNTLYFSYLVICKGHVTLVVFNDIAPSKNKFTGFLADKWKFDRKIEKTTLNLSVLNLVIFVQDTRYYTYKESLASINNYKPLISN